MVDNSDYEVTPSMKEQLAEMGRQIQETLLPLIELGKRIELQFAPMQEQLSRFAEYFPWWACERALEAAEEGDTEELDIFVRDYLGLGAGEWPYAEEALREGLRRWRIAENPIHYVGATAHRKKRWAHLDVDHKASGIQIHGSIFRKKKADWNTEPEGVLSLDVMLDMDSRRVEHDKEAWLDNDGILENEAEGIITDNDLSTITENADPFEHEGHADSIKQILPRKDYKVKEWIREAKYIQRKFVDGYYSETFTLKDEQDKLVMSSFVPRYKRKRIDPNLIYLDEGIEARVDIENEVLASGLGYFDVSVAQAWGLRPQKKYFDRNPQNQYRPGWETVGMALEDIAVYIGKSTYSYKRDKKMVEASMKRIKRRVRDGKIRHDIIQGEYVNMCGTCKHLKIKNTKRQDGGSYIRYYVCKKGKKIKSLYGLSGNCFERGNTKDISDKMFSMTYFNSRKSKLLYK